MVMAMPVSAQSSKARYLRDADHMCRATLGDGTAYEVWNRVLVTEWKAQPLYVKVWGYYRPVRETSFRGTPAVFPSMDMLASARAGL